MWKFTDICGKWDTGNKENIKEVSIAEKLQDTLRILGDKGNAIMIGSEKKGNSKIENPMGLAKILMAISLPLFMVIIGYLVLKKKIWKRFVTIQPPPNQLANIDFDVIGTSDY